MKFLKYLTLFSVLGSLLVVLTGCGEEEVTTTEDGKVVITFLTGFTGGDGAYMVEIVDGYNASQDQYYVELSQEKDHYTKFKSGDYDMVVIHGNNIETYKQDGMIQDMTSILETAGIAPEDFHEAGLQSVMFDGAMYGVPLDIHPLTMFYNKELSPTAPTNYEDLVALNTTLQAQDPNLYAVGIPSAGLVEFYFNLAAAQNGIVLETEEGYLNFAQEEYAEALMVFHDMIWEDGISPAGLGADGEFQAFMKQTEDGAYQTAVALTGPWYYSAAKDMYGDSLGIAPVPQLGSQPGTSGNSHNICVSSDVEDPEILAGIADFLAYLYTPENLLIWAEGGQAPCHLATMEAINENPEQYELAYQNIKQFDYYMAPPSVYQYGEQMRYMNETVFSILVTTEDLTTEQLMVELEKATEQAKQIAATAPQQ